MVSVTKNKDWQPQVKPFDSVEMVLVPPGCFMMGLNDTDIGALNQQNKTEFFSLSEPQTNICFDAPFWLDKTDVTNGQFKQFKGKAAKFSHWTGDKRPRDSITWFEARDFCALRGARLPTETEWEYAARGPDSLQYPWGNTFDAKNAVYSKSGGQTADVGSKPGGVSWVGALDMAGNIWQWTSSLLRPYPYDKDDGREEGTNTTEQRALRGGKWGDLSADYLRSA